MIWHKRSDEKRTVNVEYPFIEQKLFYFIQVSWTEHFMISVFVNTDGNLDTWKILLNMFQIIWNCLSQIFIGGICLFRCLCVNPYLSILFQSSILTMV